jgi:hypothetical protein
MKCPHCLIEFHDAYRQVEIGSDIEGKFMFVVRTCPSCNKFVIHLAKNHGNRNVNSRLVYPESYSRSPLPPEVPKKYSTDYIEACTVLDDSPKASAALSRRCLQNVLREEAKVKKGDLSNEIQETIDSGKLPAHLIQSLDAIRNIGNFAAHPIKSKSSGEILDVETGEAEWNLDVLESLFDFYFVQPEILNRKKAALNAKLSDAGKPPMK